MVCSQLVIRGRSDRHVGMFSKLSALYEVIMDDALVDAGLRVKKTHGVTEVAEEHCLWSPCRLTATGVNLEPRTRQKLDGIVYV